MDMHTPGLALVRGADRERCFEISVPQHGRSRIALYFDLVQVNRVGKGRQGLTRFGRVPGIQG